jgi:hypothetical protein
MEMTVLKYHSILNHAEETTAMEMGCVSMKNVFAIQDIAGLFVRLNMSFNVRHLENQIR